jgi:hypothetical protein
MAYSEVMLYETLRSVDSTTFAGTYVALGGPLLHPTSIVKLVNNSTVLITVSIDGSTDVDVVPSNGYWLYDVTSDSSKQSHVFVPQGRQYFVKGANGTGLVYLVVQYIKQS